MLHLKMSLNKKWVIQGVMKTYRSEHFAFFLSFDICYKIAQELSIYISLIDVTIILVTVHRGVMRSSLTLPPRCQTA